ncbi:g-protein alpha subunit [Lichtheimia corymbifera JMRC:FSU:9682]|uniref:G-protein alpha subunit n=1 Tax=Lichtheimia corymbifera JMRC:FSU:9682 TaxID=1263082 RepID=A0A068RW04_9FUNG|nr:g-protein alpha subunit [Lichtheimia corymbifera JMRC:FSU:9682]
MGQCCAKESLDVHEIETNRSIDKQIKTDERRMKTEVKLLLLGAGESGKSTVLKQMRLLHAAGFSASERESYRVIVFSNIFSIMQTLLEIVQQLDIEIHDKQLQEDARGYFREMPPLAKDEPFPPDYLDILKKLWADEGIQSAYEHGNSFALHDNVP